MSIIANNLLQGDEGYNISRSLRFRKSASPYLNRTPASAGNRKTWTWSGWLKRGKLGADQLFFSCSAGNNSNKNEMRFNGNDTFGLETIIGGSSSAVTTSQVFRDPSAWYHIIVACDTTQATASNRLKFYINGNQVTSFSSSNYPSQNTDMFYNSTNKHLLGAGNEFAGQVYSDLYLTEVNFIDGQALTPSSFGSTNAQTGVWQPKKYTGTYGTNGFYLPFTDVATTSGSNAGLGKDFSGNGNYWNTNNISVTSGATYDSMTDVPTLTSATQANYCVLNPLAILSNSNVSISNGNLDCTIGVSGQWRSTPASTMALPSGKWYFEVTQNNATSAGNCGIGILQSGVTYTGNFYFWNNAYGFGYNNDGNKVNNNSVTAYGSTWTSAGDVIGVAVDMVNGDLTFYKNGVSQGSAYTFDTTREYFVMLAGASSVPQYSINYGQRPFAYSAPTGYKALNTFNLPEPSIKQGNKHFDATIYSGSSTNPRTITNSGSMQPDLVWVKNRTSGTYWNVLFDSVRGAGNQLSSNQTDAELASASNVAGKVSAFNSNGFELSAGSSNALSVSAPSNEYIGWQWKANGTGSSNTAGSITSTVSANPTAGFSVVTYTGNGVNGATVGHGLGVAPKMIFVKDRSQGGTYRDWAVYSHIIGAGNSMYLNSTSGSFSKPSYWNSTTATSSVFTLGNDITVNQSGDNFVAYCFSEVAGYSKFGSYVGNGSTDGPFVYCGFRPKFVLYKCSSGLGGWLIADTSRGTYNLNDPSLIANGSDAEFTGNYIDILSNGFKFRATSGTGVNGSGSTYIFMAFAENPFKYSLAR